MTVLNRPIGVEETLDLRALGPRILPQRLAYGDLLRIIASMAVVVLHVSGDGVVQYGSTSMSNWWVCNIADSLCRWVVPVFVMLSGALLLHPSREESVQYFMRKRVSRVAVPFLFWTVFYLLLGLHFGSQSRGLRGAVDDLLSGVPYYHLHFVFVILGLYLLTPVLRVFIRHAEKSLQMYFVVTCFVLSIADLAVRVHFRYELNAFTRFVPFLGYYCAGHLLRDKVLAPAAVVRAAIGWVFAAGAAALSAAWGTARIGPHIGTIGYDPLSPATIVMSVCTFLIFASLAARNREAALWSGRATRTLANATLGVYLIHPAILGVLHHHGITAVLPNVWIGTFGASLAVIVGSFALVTLLQRVPLVRHMV